MSRQSSLSLSLFALLASVAIVARSEEPCSKCRAADDRGCVDCKKSEIGFKQDSHHAADDAREIVSLVQRLRGHLTVDDDEGELVIRLPIRALAAALHDADETDADMPHPSRVAGAQLVIFEEDEDEIQFAPVPTKPGEIELAGRLTFDGDETPHARLLVEVVPSLVGDADFVLPRDRDAVSDEHACPHGHDVEIDIRRHARRMDDNDEDEDDTRRWLETVIESQLRHLNQMMAMQLESERKVLHAKAEADAVVAKMQVQHLREIIEIQTDRAAEVQKHREAAASAERNAAETRHRQALEHAVQLAELRQEHQRDIYEARLAAAETDVAHLRQLVAARDRAPGDSTVPATLRSDAANSARAGTIVTDAASSPIEVTLQVEDLSSGRVRYGVAPSPTARSTHAPPLVVVAPTDVHPPAVAADRAVPAAAPSNVAEVDRLRREVARLRALVEDLLCINPELPPTPVAQRPGDEVNR